jgi:hypothetical protein
MPVAPQNSESWQFQHPSGNLHCGHLTAKVDAAQPQLGLHHIRLRSQSLSGHLLAVLPDNSHSWPADLADAYVRNRDLVATYAPSTAWPYAPQIYWRAESLTPSGVVAAVSLLVSIQTNLLDTHPLLSATSQLPVDEVLSIASGDQLPQIEPLARGTHAIPSNAFTHGLVWRLPGGQISYAEFATASDFQQLSADIAPGSLCTARWQLFTDFLEKGVIRRARLQAAFLPRENDVALASEFARSLASRPLPLTT